VTDDEREANRCDPLADAVDATAGMAREQFSYCRSGYVVLALFADGDPLT
jgi:hypothetical protein